MLDDLAKSGPRHIAVIMDGNGRWARGRGLPRIAGHRAGARAAERLIRYVGEHQSASYVTLFAFSTENWRRPPEEIAFLMDLFAEYFRDKCDEMVEQGVCLRVAGQLDRLPRSVQDAARHAMEQTQAGQRIVVNIALSYGGREEILHAVKRLSRRVERGEMSAEQLTEEALAGELYTAGIPDPDLIIRTSGEMRLSNFLLWQAAYAELYFSETLWPDFGPDDLEQALDAFRRRDRRFGRQ
ncbi:di-trans,poly-cis-decaprenylcistransferase [Candidatus Bipolaricaulota bacterium]|nr:di-trans,poly-cis-decaprenylcistransferase [Candidatus Bipolaricaulota bacterium]